MNTWFQHHQRHLYTWKSPGDGIRYQIDYITMNKRFRNAITQVKGYPGADCGSDNVQIVATMKVRLRTLKRKKADVKLQLYLLTADNEHSRQYNQMVSVRIAGINAIDYIKARYQHFRETLTESVQQVLPEVERTARQKWMTAPIQQKVEQRRLAKGNATLYNLLDREIRQDCRTAKETMLTEQCHVIEQLDDAHKSNPMHSQINLVTGRKRGNNTTTCIEDKNGDITMEKDEILSG